MAAQFAQEGAEWIHLVDLDGAKAGRKVNDRHVLDIARQLDVKVEIGGGIRSEADVYGYLSQGVDRVILGSSAVSDPAFVKSMLKQYGGKIAIGLDARNGYVSTEGWLETSSVRAADLGRELAEEGAETFIFTDIATDGMLSGPNIESTVQLAKATGNRHRFRRSQLSRRSQSTGPLQRRRRIGSDYRKSAVYKTIYIG